MKGREGKGSKRGGGGEGSPLNKLYTRVCAASKGKVFERFGLKVGMENELGFHFTIFVFYWNASYATSRDVWSELKVLTRQLACTFSKLYFHWTQIICSSIIFLCLGTIVCFVVRSFVLSTNHIETHRSPTNGRYLPTKCKLIPWSTSPGITPSIPEKLYSVLFKLCAFFFFFQLMKP